MMYRVTWTLDVDAETPLLAAIAARRVQTRNGTTATVFEVTDRTGNICVVDTGPEDEDVTVLEERAHAH
jgi:hypothetical protein